MELVIGVYEGVWGLWLGLEAEVKIAITECFAMEWGMS